MSRRLTGVFQLGNQDELVRDLAADLSLRVSGSPREIVLS